MSQGNCFGSRETGFAVTLAKIFIIILVVKQVTYNSKVSDVTIFFIF